MNPDILVFGSINIDHVYRVPDFVRPGETLSCLHYQRLPGGKGANQAVALARSGLPVSFAGACNKNDLWLSEILEKEQVDTRFLLQSEMPSGHALVQVNAAGENAIVIHPGANHGFSREQIDRILDAFPSKSLLVLQNEINDTPYLLQAARKRRFIISFNPAPADEHCASLPRLADIVFLNHSECLRLGGQDTLKASFERLCREAPETAFVLTLGERGARYRFREKDIFQAAFPVTSVDTTGAGDTFVAYFLHDWIQGQDPARALESACRAAALAVRKPGALKAIPFRHELQNKAFS
jgi:ribokinase